MKLIDKDALVAEIEKCIYRCNEKKRSCPVNTQVEAICDNKISAYNEVLSSIDTLEVKEVDLENEINNYISNNFFGSQTMGFFANRTKKEPNDQDIVLCAKHFFELGLKAQKGEETVSIWHDASEEPKREDLLIETNDGRIIHRQSINNYGMVKRWVYTSDLLNLDNSCNFGKNSQEEPKKCMYTKDNYTDEDRKVPCEDCDEDCEYAKKVEPVSEEECNITGIRSVNAKGKLKEMLDNIGEESVARTRKQMEEEHLEAEIIRYIGYPQEVDEDVSTTMIRKAARHFANWQKQQDNETIKDRIINAYNRGLEQMKQQMMKDAIDGQLEDSDDYFRIKCLSTSCKPEDNGKLVKVIIVKEDWYGNKN